MKKRRSGGIVWCIYHSIRKNVMDQNLAQGASQNLEQTHILSPQHLQALKALQAPLMELSGSFADVLAENPLITDRKSVV